MSHDTSLNENTVDARCAEMANNGAELCRFIWNAKDFLTMRWRLDHFGVHVASAADRIIALRTQQAAALGVQQ
jgi:hypothetical protein